MVPKPGQVWRHQGGFTVWILEVAGLHDYYRCKVVGLPERGGSSYALVDINVWHVSDRYWARVDVAYPKFPEFIDF